MASFAVVQQKQPSYALLPSSFSDFNGIRLSNSVPYKRKALQPSGTLHTTASRAKKILVMVATRIIHVSSSRLLKQGHQVTLFTRGQAPIIQQLPDELDQRYLTFKSKILHLKGDRKDLDFMRSSHSAEGFDVVYDINGREADEMAPIQPHLCGQDKSYPHDSLKNSTTTAFAVSKRNAVAAIFSVCLGSNSFLQNIAAFAQPSVGLREYIDTFDGYSFKYPQNWIQVKGAGADIFFRDPFILDENLSVDISSPSSSSYKSVEDLGSPQEAGKKILKQYLIEFMSTRLGVRRESSILSTSTRVADDGRVYYQVEVNIKSYANNNELAVMPQERVARLEWNRRYLSVLGVENNRLYQLRLQTPERVFLEEESDLRQVMDSFRVNKITA